MAIPPIPKWRTLGKRCNVNKTIMTCTKQAIDVCNGTMAILSVVGKVIMLVNTVEMRDDTGPWP